MIKGLLYLAALSATIITPAIFVLSYLFLVGLVFGVLEFLKLIGAAV